MSSPKKIFICYRRDDAEGYAGRIYDRLHARFPGRVFMDVTGISPGADFTRVIQDTVGTSHVLLAIIGKQWLTITDDAGKPRIQSENDYVRHEIATALYRNIAVIPVLVRDARMPSESSLPPDLASLSKRNALEISDDDFEHDALRLISAIEYVLGERRVVPPPPPPKTGGGNRTCLILALVAIVLGGGGFLFLLLMGAIIDGNRNEGGGGGPYPPPTATATQQPSYEVAENQFPIGHWTMTLFSTADGHQEQHSLDIFAGGTCQVNGQSYRWVYSPEQSTIGFENLGTVTITSQTSDGFVGYANFGGNAYTMALTH